MSDGYLHSFVDNLRGSTRGVVASISEAYRDDFKESVQTIVWIVSLATGALVLLASADSPQLSPTAERWVVGLLLATILSGVAQRVAQRISSLKLRSMITIAEVVANTADTAIPVPIALPSWTFENFRVNAVAAHGESYEEAFRQLERLGDIEATRALYELLRIGERMGYVGSLVEAMEGTLPVTEKDPSKRSSLQDLAVMGKSFDRSLDVSNALYFVTCGLFSISLAVIGFTLLR